MANSSSALQLNVVDCSFQDEIMGKTEINESGKR
jgi:hypothetical protein